MPTEVRIEGIGKLEDEGRLAARSVSVLQAGIFKAADLFGLDAVARAKKDYLSGPRPDRLGVVTGRLRSSITKKTTEEDDGVVVQVGTNVRYAAAWEFGFDGVQQVDAHLRVVSKVFGRSVNATVTQVRAHSRKVNNKAKPFLQPAIDDAMPALDNRISNVLETLPFLGD